jgi:hypothetical protein
VTLDIIVPV